MGCCGFACMECGYAFKTIKAAEKASFGPKGCPKCGGSDIDLARSNPLEVERTLAGIEAAALAKGGA